jgi:pyridoxal biosynthesis lyase PdxS
MSEQEVLLPAEAAQRLDVPTRVVVQAMYEKRLPRVKLDDGTLGIPADALDSFHVQTAERRTAELGG